MVRTILDTTKHPQRPADTPHVYEDKYGLVEQATRASVVAAFNALDVYGVNGDHLKGMIAWAGANKSVSLRLASTGEQISELAFFLQIFFVFRPLTTVVAVISLFFYILFR